MGFLDGYMIDIDRRGLPQLPPNYDIELDNERHMVMIAYKGYISEISFEEWYMHITQSGFLEYVLRSVKNAYEQDWRSAENITYLRGDPPGMVPRKIYEAPDFVRRRIQFENAREANKSKPPERSIKWDF